ncbi:hypothetical protein WN51_10515 [Melipona quadrifasciata]|uniref:Uncharacterized protein n=1 Tax=Melipona quadrifasciata TaxID=166423 RepID=A0A0M9A6Z4_9HYME|nr:hypothetical protein WN51_10515 [Melipona quadrifasciata]
MNFLWQMLAYVKTSRDLLCYYMLSIASVLLTVKQTTKTLTVKWKREIKYTQLQRKNKSFVIFILWSMEQRMRLNTWNETARFKRHQLRIHVCTGIDLSLIRHKSTIYRYNAIILYYNNCVSILIAVSGKPPMGGIWAHFPTRSRDITGETIFKKTAVSREPHIIAVSGKPPMGGIWAHFPTRSRDIPAETILKKTAVSREPHINLVLLNRIPRNDVERSFDTLVDGISESSQKEHSSNNTFSVEELFVFYYKFVVQSNIVTKLEQNDRHYDDRQHTGRLYQKGNIENMKSKKSSKPVAEKRLELANRRGDNARPHVALSVRQKLLSKLKQFWKEGIMRLPERWKKVTERFIYNIINPS